MRGVCLGTFECFLITNVEQPCCCCRVGIYITCWRGGVAGWMMEFVWTPQHLCVRTKGRTWGSLAAIWRGCFSQALLVLWMRLVATSRMSYGPGVSAGGAQSCQKKSSAGFGSFPRVCAECFRKPLLCPPPEGGAVAVYTRGRRPGFYLMTFLPEKQNHTQTYISQMKVNACCTLSYECFLCSGGITDHLFPF